MLLTFKQKIKLTHEQIDIINATQEEGRLLYNSLLQEKNEFYEKEKKYLSYYQQQAKLKTYDSQYLTYDMKKEICRTLDNNYSSFFALFKKNKDKNPQTPKFRGKNYFFTLSFTQDFIIKDNILRLSNKKCKYIDIPINHIFKDRSISVRNKSKSILKQCKLYKQDDEYFISIVYFVPDNNEIETNNTLAIDLGKKNIVTYYDEKTNTGCNINSDYYFKNEKYFDKRIEELQSKQDKKQKGSIKWKKLNKKKRTLQKKKNKQNQLALHRLSKLIAKSERDIVIGELTNLKQNTVSKYNKLNKQMQNNWQLKIFVNQLEYKCKKYGRKLAKINEAYTSKTCCHCGSINHGLTPSIRTYKCADCGFEIDRDVNGAINIYNRYKQTEMGDYNTPNLETLVSDKRFFGNFRKTNQFFINL
jgi:putative transposase